MLLMGILTRFTNSTRPCSKCSKSAVLLATKSPKTCDTGAGIEGILVSTMAARRVACVAMLVTKRPLVILLQSVVVCKRSSVDVVQLTRPVVLVQ